MLSPSPELERRKRELRLKIGRLRRQIDRRALDARRESERLLSWRTVVRRLPGNTMLAAFGAGLALAAGLSARSLGRWLGLRMVRHALGEGRRAAWSELHRIWADSAPRTAAPKEAADDD